MEVKLNFSGQDQVLKSLEVYFRKASHFLGLNNIAHSEPKNRRRSCHGGSVIDSMESSATDCKEMSRGEHAKALSVNGFFCFIFPSFFASFFGWREHKNEAKMKVKNPLSRHGVLREVLASFFFPSFFAVGHRAKIFDCYTNSHICIIYYLFLRSDMRNFLGL